MTPTTATRHMLAINPANVTDRTVRHIASRAELTGAGITANHATITRLARAAIPFGPLHNLPGLARILGVPVTADRRIPDNVIEIA